MYVPIRAMVIMAMPWSDCCAIDADDRGGRDERSDGLSMMMIIALMVCR
jgi:hypothetical protein